MPWVKTQTSQKNPLKPAAKAAALKTLEAFVGEHYKIAPPPADQRWNYVVGFSARWHGPYLYLRSKWACLAPSAISPFFERDFVRLGVRHGDRWNLWARRHNDEWICLGEELLIGECFAQMRTDPWFQIG